MSNDYYLGHVIEPQAYRKTAAMRAFREVGYSQMIVPDHFPSITGDSEGHGGWGFALGYIQALLKATS